ncbi:MAG: hypothetical protein JWQ02_2841 [Capsulimonas sp.]|nr:hypothetical protein [Capsulimonas sp.]
MNEQRDPWLPLIGHPPGANASQAVIGDYLDYLCAPMLGIVPYNQRRRLRAEAEDHLLALVEDFAAEGFTPGEAVTVALKEYGDPWRIGQEWADAWLRGAAPSRLARITDAATLRAFGWFGVFTVVNLLALEIYVLEPSQRGILSLTQVLSVVSPIAAGISTGLGLGSRIGAGVVRAMTALSAASAAIGLLLLPHLEVLTFAAMQFLFWIPAGALSATVIAALRRQLRLQGYRPTTR